MDIQDLRTHIFVGNDLNVRLEFTGAELEAIFDRLLPLLREQSLTVRDGRVRGGSQEMTLSMAQAEALGKYLAARPAIERGQREERYLTRLIIDPTYRRWTTRYVALTGGYRPAPQLDPRYREVLVRGDGPARQIERRPLKDIQEAMALHAVFIVLARPGAGKTTVLERIALAEAHRALCAGDAARLPFFVRLAAQKPDEDPHAFLARLWQIEMACTPEEAAAELAAMLKQGRLCLLCDALNEARRERYTERVQEWKAFWRGLPSGNALIFTSRTLDYQGDLAAPQVEIDALTDDQIEEFAGRYLDDPAAGRALRDLLATRHAALLPLARTPYYLLLMVEVYAAEHDLPANRARLFEGWVQRLLAREEDRNHAHWLPAAAQHVALSELAYAMQALGEGTLVDQAWACNVLPEAVMLPASETQPAPQSVATPPAAVLELAHGASLLMTTAEEGLRFVHHLLQEYFAAEALLRRFAAGEDLAPLWRTPYTQKAMPPAPRGEWDPLPPPPPTRWEQTTILAASLYPALIEAVTAVNPALAAACVVEMGRLESKRLESKRLEIEESETDCAVWSIAQSPIANFQSRISALLLDRLGSPAVHLRSRIEAGLWLGRLRDPRFPVETVNRVRVILPPVAPIAGGKATIGSHWLDRLADKDEKPRHDVRLAAYALGRYPVTNAEFACFMQAGGYEEETLWTAGGQFWRRGEPVPGEDDPVDWYMDQWRRNRERPQRIDERLKQSVYTPQGAEQWHRLITWTEDEITVLFRSWYPTGQVRRQPEYWDDDAFNNPSQPVVGVTWYEAMAYATWLARVTGQGWRLPTEPEWEWAARRGARVYPWGNRWDADRLNSLEGRVMRTTPVGAYPHGATPDGICDLAGNVWEWTATWQTEYPYRADGSLEDPDRPGMRIARGGGWAAVRKMVRGGYRGGNDPGDRDNLL
jgi:formylglycine-generating enzyme required for sulfatase activity